MTAPGIATIYDVPFQIRTRRALEKAGLVYLGQVEIRSDDEFLKLDGIGKGAVADIRKIVPYRPPLFRL